MDPSVDRRDKTSPIIKSLSEKNSCCIEIQNKGADFDRFRNREISVENAVRETTFTSDSFLQQRVFGPLRTFQNGGGTAVTKSHGRGRLVSKTRFKSCVHDNTCGRGTSQISEIFLEKQNYGVYLPSIRNCNSTVCVFIKKMKIPITILRRLGTRHSDYEPISHRH